MTPRERTFQIRYGDAAVQHLRHLTGHQRALALDTVVEQLTHQPAQPTRNRKLLRANPLAPWELRIGDIRVYFDVEEAPEAIVTVRAVGLKLREKVLIGGVEVDLT
jgi:mRNA-degrading endonuclease RelE of RelBE toxin-antitoxin system